MCLFALFFNFLSCPAGAAPLVQPSASHPGQLFACSSFVVTVFYFCCFDKPPKIIRLVLKNNISLCLSVVVFLPLLHFLIKFPYLLRSPLLTLLYQYSPTGGFRGAGAPLINNICSQYPTLMDFVLTKVLIHCIFRIPLSG